jgi:hypothetical protein
VYKIKKFFEIHYNDDNHCDGDIYDFGDGHVVGDFNDDHGDRSYYLVRDLLIIFGQYIVFVRSLHSRGCFPSSPVVLLLC